MTQEHHRDLDPHLDRLMELAYESLASGESERRRAESNASGPQVPDRIGPYPVSGLLGRGGTSFVFKGHDPELGRDMAIKVIDQRYPPGSGLAQRFLDEARICSQLSHPGIVPIYNVGQLDDGRPYFTMQLVDGQTLAAMLNARVDPDDRRQQFLEILARVCETVAFAHARGVIHGDLKPGNVMVGAFGQVQVMDWGFSRLVDASSADAKGAAGDRGMGTPAFMAPEQAHHGNALDARTDVFGLGAILCVILTGAPPFLGGSRSEVHLRAAQGFLGDARARLHACGADRELVALAEQCIEAAPASRPIDAGQVVSRLSAWFASTKERAHQLELAAAEAQVKAAEQRRTRRRSMALALLAVTFAVAYAWLQFDRQARDYETRLAIVQAIERARNLHAGADIAGAERIRWLSEAASAAQQATRFALTLDDAALRGEAEDLSRRLDGDRDAAVRDDTMAKWLDDFPSHIERTPDQLDQDFVEGFRSYGVDVETLPRDEVVARLRARSIAPALARALDDWGFVRRALGGVQPSAWRQFHELALRVDEEPLRSAMRRALLAGDRNALRGLADSAAIADAGTDSLDLLANCLAQVSDRPAAIQVWQRANARYPDSVRVIHSLAVQLLADAKCPPWDEIVRLFTAGTALRPASAHLWTDLSYALLGQGDVEGAEAALHRALERSPRDDRALDNLVDLLRCQGRSAEALTASRSAVDRAEDAAGTWRVRGDTLLVAGSLDEAAAAYRRAVALDATGIHRERLGRCLLELGNLDEAIQCFRGALDHRATRASAQAHLGLALRQRGRFVEAITALRSGRGADGTTWAQQCDAWLGETERAAASAKALASLGEDILDPLDSTASVERALVAHLGGRSLAAARCYRATFARDPAAAEGAFLGENRDWAAQAAVKVSTGAATDGTGLGADERAEWRAQAIAWRRDAIAALRRAFDTGVQSPANVRQRLAAWRHEPALAGAETGLQADLDGLQAHLAAGESAAVVHPPFDRSHAFRMLGSIPGVLKPYGGLLFDHGDPDALVVAGHAQRLTASLSEVSLTRDAHGHIDGFRGKARHLAAVPWADGGIARGPRGVLLYARYPAAEIGQLRPESRVTDRVEKLAGPSSGGFGFVPPGLPGAGRAKRLAWPGGEWFDADGETRPEGHVLVNQRQVASLSGGPDGFVYVDPGAPPFDRPTLLVAEWSLHSIAAYDIDAQGDPIPATRRVVVSGCRGALSLAVDPATGDVLVSTWRGDGTEQIGVLRRIGP